MASSGSRTLNLSKSCPVVPPKSCASAARLEKLAQHFEAYNLNEGLSPRTVECYSRMLNYFGEYLEQHRRGHNIYCPLTNIVPREVAAITRSVTLLKIQRPTNESDIQPAAWVRPWVVIATKSQRFCRTYPRISSAALACLGNPVV